MGKVSQLMEYLVKHRYLTLEDLILLPHFNLSKCMECEQCLGVVRYFLLLFTLPKFKDEIWHIGKRAQIDELNRKLKDIKHPYEVTRTPQSLDCIPYWKHNENRELWWTKYKYICGDQPEYTSPQPSLRNSSQRIEKRELSSSVD